MTDRRTTRFRSFGPNQFADWVASGFRVRDYFPHRSYYLRKAAPDGRTLAVRSGLRPERAEFWQLVVFARPPSTDGLPSELFFDDEIMWHGQHYSLPGQVATASMVIEGAQLSTAAHHSDLVQRISRRRHLKTQVEARFQGWDRMLMNSILAFAIEQGIPTVRVPTADAALEHADRTRPVQRELFDRVYDRHVRDTYRAQRTDRWWTIDVAANRQLVTLGDTTTETMSSAKTICVAHDIERGLGHRQVDPAFAERADADAADALERMIDVELNERVTATYNVVGNMMDDVRDPIEAGGHCLGFHTFDHYLDRRAERARSLLARRLRIGSVPDGRPRTMQLSGCRSVDHRLKGYRPAQSRLGGDTDEGHLAHHNFEWLASSSRSLGIEGPQLERGIVKVPIRCDDFPLHQGMSYEQWEARVTELAGDCEFFAISLHDCYGPAWSAGYPELLKRLSDLGTLKTFDQVAAEVFLQHAG